jgi:hypothetical protein
MMNQRALESCDVGMPQDRLARLAARRAFVDLKHDFMVATAGLPGAQGAWLRETVRRAEDPYRLWLLRHSVFAALGGVDADAQFVRQALSSRLETVFGEAELQIAGPR